MDSMRFGNSAKSRTPRSLRYRDSRALAVFKCSLAALGLAVLSVSLAAAQSGAIPPTGVVSWWQANGDASDGIGSNDGSPLNGATFDASIVTDGTGQAFQFDGINDVVSVPDHPSLDITGAISGAAWVKATDYNCHDTRRIVSKLNYTPLSGWSLDIVCNGQFSGALTGALRFAIFDSGTNWFHEITLPNATVPQGEWTHVGFTWDGVGTVRLYINGVAERQMTWAPGVMGDIGAHSRPLEIGAWGSAYFKGLIDEVMIFNRELTPAEMMGLYAPRVPVVLSVTSAQEPVAVGASVNATASFIDTDGNTSIGSIDWGDGSTSPATIDADAGTASGNHTYTDAGVYTVAVTLTDDDSNTGSGTYQYVVVYDPDGGFVTGGGWIDSPPGAYTPAPSLTGKATFGFVAKYMQGANVPEGNTEFQFKAGDLNFQSTSYDWLVVAGQDKAKYKGTGTINGAGSYKFMLTAIDNGTSGDKFHIRIWDDNGVVYDNHGSSGDDAYDGTVIGGGNIKIHKK